MMSSPRITDGSGDKLGAGDGDGARETDGKLALLSSVCILCCLLR
jgi:hypothetical protein